MSPDSPFRVAGPQQLFQGVTTAPAAGVQLTPNAQGAGGEITVMFYNPGPNTVIFGYGATAVAAQTAAATGLPTSVGPANGTNTITVPPGQQPYTSNWQTFWSCLSLTASQNAYATPGDGA